MRSARNGVAAGECKCSAVQRGKRDRKREKIVENEKKEGWVRERENAGAATPCKRKIYKLESPIKSVPAVTTSPLSPFHVERWLFVSFLSPSSRRLPGVSFTPRKSGFTRFGIMTQDFAIRYTRPISIESR
ncbi:hypothetical protein ALC60_10895 [Trachymyrmex zeteki]|uniref:Uncharacterized protein n=1 Tax=Mycetomoellerius zeteki TaxID=64791 RepID=A0A151WQ42_9HYME|nr:hypothetical protein ALC60_10895 [Trachymyrmex zeteki]